MALLTKNSKKKFIDGSSIQIRSTSGPYFVYGTDTTSNAEGFFYPLWTSQTDSDAADLTYGSNTANGTSHTHEFYEYPNTLFFMPDTFMNHGQTTRPVSNDSIVYTEFLNTQNTFYAVASRSQPWDDEDSPDVEVDSVEADLDFRYSMLFGKRIAESDVAYMVRRYDWESGNTYVQYDHTKDLTNTAFYVKTSSNNVYKCLYNNSNTASTDEPVTVSNTPFTTSDGYVWKYMYTISSANTLKFSTSTYMPIDVNTDIVTSASNGAIDVINVTNGGIGYVSTSNVFAGVVNTTLFQLQTSESTDSGKYVDSSLYILSGAAVGEISKISNYISNSSGRFVQVETPIANVDVATTYLISPTVVISGDGSGAKAYSTVNATSTSIDGVYVVDTGSDYGYVNTTITANTTHGSGAVVQASLPPKGGHGANPIQELQCERFCVSVDFDSNLDTDLPTDIDYRQVGLISGIQYLNSEVTDYDANTDVTTYSNTVYDYHEPYIRATTDLTITVATPFDEDEVVDGLTSGAMGTVVFSNTTLTTLSNVIGDFDVAESILGRQTGISGTISGINKPDILKTTGEFLYMDNTVAVERSNTGIETVKLIIKF